MKPRVNGTALALPPGDPRRNAQEPQLVIEIRIFGLIRKMREEGFPRRHEADVGASAPVEFHSSGSTPADARPQRAPVGWPVESS